jgi:hypothetical protein
MKAVSPVAPPPFRVGEPVVCVDGDFSESLAGLRLDYDVPEAGEIYVVRAIEPLWSDRSAWAIRLEEVVNFEHWYSGLGVQMEAHWSANRFRPFLAH